MITNFSTVNWLSCVMAGHMLAFYGEKSIIDAICIISHCPFLLNQAENSTGWFITFKWMLEDSHFESILAGDYLDRDDPLKANLQGEYEEDSCKYRCGGAACPEK